MGFGGEAAAVRKRTPAKRSEERRVGERSGEGLPGTIPNPEVKLTSAEGTAVVTPWERTSLPTLPSSSPFTDFLLSLPFSFVDVDIYQANRRSSIGTPVLIPSVVFPRLCCLDGLN